MFEAKTYKERRQALRQKVDGGIILLLGNDDSGMNFKDNTYHFRQDSSFLYFFGLNQPGLVGIIDENGEATIYGDDLTIDHIVWTGNQPTIKERAATAGVKNTKNYAQVATDVAQAKKVHILPPYRAEHVLKYSEWLSLPFHEVEAHKSVALIKAIVSLRSYKTSEEVVEIEKAVNVSIDMHTAAMQYAVPGMKESEVVAKVHATALASGGNLSFPIIGTINGQILHNHYHGNIIKEGDMFLCDSGAETTTGYAGDLTRTFPVAAKFDTRQKELYDIVLSAHFAALDAVKPGILYKDVHLLACKKLTEGLKAVGLMKGDVDEAVSAGAHAMFFQCGLGHMMGMDVHDMENLGEEYVGYTPELKKDTQFGLKSLRLGRVLEEGFVITVEPGIYIIPELIDLWSKDKKFEEFIDYKTLNDFRDFGGIRVEDDVLLTKDGSRKLGKPLARTSEEVEEVRQRALQYV